MVVWEKAGVRAGRGQKGNDAQVPLHPNTAMGVLSYEREIRIWNGQLHTLNESLGCSVGTSASPLPHSSH